MKVQKKNNFHTHYKHSTVSLLSAKQVGVILVFLSIGLQGLVSTENVHTSYILNKVKTPPPLIKTTLSTFLSERGFIFTKKLAAYLIPKKHSL